MLGNWGYCFFILIAYYKKQLELLKVDVKYNTLVTKDTIGQYVVATGSVPIKIDFEGAKGAVTAEEVLM